MADGNQMIKLEVLYEDNHIIVVVKEPNIPVCLDESNDLDLITIIKEYLKEKYNKPGNVYLGLVHRLDRPVSGVMVFAKTSKAASRLSEQIRNKQIKKNYYAVVEGMVKKENKLVDYLLKDTKTNITKVDKSGKYSELNYKLVKYLDNLSLVDIELITGRAHQIRVQFASRGNPLVNDNKYNNNALKGNIALYAYRLSFIHPITKEVMTFTKQLPNYYPFSLFNK